MSLSEKVFQGPKVVVNRFGWNWAQKLGVMRYFQNHFSSLLWLLPLESSLLWLLPLELRGGGGGARFCPLGTKNPAFQGDPPSKFCCQMNLFMNSIIIELSIYAWNFVLKVLHREEPGARIWPKLMSKLQPKIAIFQNFGIFLHTFHTYTTVYFRHPIIKISWEKFGLLCFIEFLEQTRMPL